MATGTLGVPSARCNHTAIWTGSEMIVWGGNFNNNTGGRYNPVIDIWVATTTSGAPSGRYDHTGIWTGSEMIVWGGNGADSPDYVGAYYPYDEDKLTQNQLTVNVTGQGSVISNPAGIDCGSTCIADFYQWGIASLIAQFDPSWTKGSWEWSGACTGKGGCVITMDQDKTVNVAFHCELIRISGNTQPKWQCFDLEAVNEFVVGIGGEVTFKAGNSIKLGAGFRVMPGGIFHATAGP